MWSFPAFDTEDFYDSSSAQNGNSSSDWMQNIIIMHVLTAV